MYHVRMLYEEIRYRCAMARIRTWYWYKRTLLKIKHSEKLRWLIKKIYINFAHHSTLMTLGEWVDYQSGFSGTGPTALDKAPKSKPSWLGKWLVQDEIWEIKKVKMGCWVTACMETLGEDPREW